MRMYEYKIHIAAQTQRFRQGAIAPGRLVAHIQRRSVLAVGYYRFYSPASWDKRTFHSTMAQVVDFFPTTAFDPETVKLLCDAYDRVQKSLHDAGQPDIVNEVIAKRIIALAKQGERNPDKLCEGVLEAFGTKEQRLSR